MLSTIQAVQRLSLRLSVWYCIKPAFSGFEHSVLHADGAGTFCIMFLQAVQLQSVINVLLDHFPTQQVRRICDQCNIEYV